MLLYFCFNSLLLYVKLKSTLAVLMKKVDLDKLDSIVSVLLNSSFKFFTVFSKPSICLSKDKHSPYRKKRN